MNLSARPETILFALAVALAGCSGVKKRNEAPAVAHAYAGPATLDIHKELNPKSPVVTTVKHGEELDILDYRRRYLKVRTPSGVTGWTDTRELLTPEQMAALRKLTKDARDYPPEGKAVTLEVLNVHSEPNRLSPSFLQIPEKGEMEVIGHRVMPRTQAAVALPRPPPKPRVVRRRRKDKGGGTLALPVAPDAPRPPPNWLALSQTREQKRTDGDARPAPAPKKPEPPPKPIALDDWTLIRTKDGSAGWVLSRMLSMAIPDDVAQYSEGHRITSYFDMGEVHDEETGETKHDWLWTTIRKGGEPYDFDSFRFFIWSRKHHRYETAYVQKDVVGHYPVETAPKTTPPTFSLILEGEGGGLFRKTYKFEAGRVYLIDTAPYDPRAPKQLAAEPRKEPAGAAKGTAGSWLSSLAARVGRLFHR